MTDSTFSKLYRIRISLLIFSGWVSSVIITTYVNDHVNTLFTFLLVGELVLLPFALFPTNFITRLKRYESSLPSGESV